MRLLHTADIHLDSKLNANLSKTSAKERRLEILNTFLRMIDYAAENAVDGILIAGDLFDVKNISALSRNAVCDAILSHPDIRFFYLRGNHDFATIIDAFDDMPDNLFLFNDKWTSYTLGEKNLVTIHGVELSMDNSSSVQASFAPDPSKINIVMLHGQESESNAGDKTEVINIKQFRNKGIDYMALGHVHAYKCAELDGSGKYCYCGCLEGRGFDELGDHGFVILDIDEEKKIVTDTFVSFAYRKIYEVQVDITGLQDSPSILNKVKVELSLLPAKEIDLVKIVLCGEVGVECEKDTEFIAHSCEDDYYYLKVYDKSTIKIDPKTYMYDSSLKGEFVRTVLENDSLSESEKGEIIKIGLDALMGGKIEL